MPEKLGTAQRFPLAGGVRPLHGSLPGAGLAVAVRRGQNSLRRRLAVLSAARLPGALVRDRPVAVLDAEHLRRLAADRRSAVADLLPPACLLALLDAAARARGSPTSLTFALLYRRRARHHPVFPRPRLACRRRAGRGAGVCVRRLGRVAHPARRADREPGVPAAGAVAADAGARALVVARRRGRGRVRRA